MLIPQVTLTSLMMLAWLVALFWAAVPIYAKRCSAAVWPLPVESLLLRTMSLTPYLILPKPSCARGVATIDRARSAMCGADAVGGQSLRKDKRMNKVALTSSSNS